MYSKFELQGQKFMQGVYDGESLWNTNFQTMKPEKATSEDLANHKLGLNDFPDPLINYKANEYTAEYIGTETFDGAETYKIKLTKEPMTIDGEQIEDFEFYYFEIDSGALIGMQKEMMGGPMKGIVGITTFSDYQEVEGLYMPFTVSMGTKEGAAQAMTIQSVELNPEVDMSILAFPEPVVEEEEKK